MPQDPTDSGVPYVQAPRVNYSKPVTVDVYPSIQNTLAAADDDRVWVTVTNLTTTPVYIGVGDHGAIVGRGIPLMTTGSSVEIDDSTGAVYAIHESTGAKAVAVQSATKA